MDDKKNDVATSQEAETEPAVAPILPPASAPTSPTAPQLPPEKSRARARLKAGLKELPAEKKSHEPSGAVCTAPVHFDGQGPCIICKHCNQKVRPQDMAQPCWAR